MQTCLHGAYPCLGVLLTLAALSGLAGCYAYPYDAVPVYYGAPVYVAPYVPPQVYIYRKWGGWRPNPSHHHHHGYGRWHR